MLTIQEEKECALMVWLAHAVMWGSVWTWLYILSPTPTWAVWGGVETTSEPPASEHWLCYFLIWGRASSSAASSIGTLSVSCWFTLDFPEDFIYLFMFIFYTTCPGAEGWVDHSIRSRFPISPWSWGPMGPPTLPCFIHFLGSPQSPTYLLSSLAPKVCVFASLSVMSDSLQP